MPLFPPPYRTSDIFNVACFLVWSCYVTKSKMFFEHSQTRKCTSKAMTPPQGLIHSVALHREKKKLFCCETKTRHSNYILLFTIRLNKLHSLHFPCSKVTLPALEKLKALD